MRGSFALQYCSLPLFTTNYPDPLPRVLTICRLGFVKTCSYRLFCFTSIYIYSADDEMRKIPKNALCLYMMYVCMLCILYQSSHSVVSSLLRKHTLSSHTCHVFCAANAILMNMCRECMHEHTHTHTHQIVGDKTQTIELPYCMQCQYTVNDTYSCIQTTFCTLLDYSPYGSSAVHGVARFAAIRDNKKVGVVWCRLCM